MVPAGRSVTLARVIRMHQSLERGRRHPILGPLLLLLLVGLLALTVLHETSESSSSGIGELCIGIVLVLLTAVLGAPARRAPSVLVVVAAIRGPPRIFKTRLIHTPARPDILPLRL